MRQSPSGIGTFAKATFGIALLVLAHFSIRPIVGGRAPLDFLAIAVLFTAVRVRPGAAALIGFFAGIIVDALTPVSFGAGAIAFTLVAYAASWLKAVFFADHVALTGLFVFLGKWLFDAIYLVAGRGSRGTDRGLERASAARSEACRAVRASLCAARSRRTLPRARSLIHADPGRVSPRPGSSVHGRPST